MGGGGVGAGESRIILRRRTALQPSGVTCITRDFGIFCHVQKPDCDSQDCRVSKSHRVTSYDVVIPRRHTTFKPRSHQPYDDLRWVNFSDRGPSGVNRV